MTKDGLDILTGSVPYSDMVAGAQVVPAPYWAGAPVGTKEVPTEQNIKALMLGMNQSGVEHWATDPTQLQSTARDDDDIIITYSFVQDSSTKFTPDNGSTLGDYANGLGHD